MRKNRKLYGIIDPNIFDYLLAIVAGLVAMSALWIGIMVSVYNAYNFSGDAWQSFLSAFSFNVGEGNLMVIFGSVSIYVFALVAVVLSCIAVIKQKYRELIASISIFIVGIVNALLIAFFGTFVNPVETGVPGVFPIIIMMMILGLLFCAKLSFDICVCKLFSNFEEEQEEEYVPEYVQPEPEEEPKQKAEKKVEEEKPLPEEEEEEEEEFQPENEVIKEEIHAIESSDGKSLSINSKKLTFEQKLRRANKETRVIYRELRDYFEEIGFKLKIAKTGAIFYHKQTKYAVIAVSGKNSLKVYYKLDMANYVDSPIPLVDVQNVRKYEKTPVYLKVKSELSVKRAKHLMDDVKANLDND